MPDQSPIQIFASDPKVKRGPEYHIGAGWGLTTGGPGGVTVLQCDSVFMTPLSTVYLESTGKHTEHTLEAVEHTVETGKHSPFLPVRQVPVKTQDPWLTQCSG